MYAPECQDAEVHEAHDIVQPGANGCYNVQGVPGLQRFHAEYMEFSKYLDVTAVGLILDIEEMLIPLNLYFC